MDLELILNLIRERRDAWNAYKLAQERYLLEKDRESFNSLVHAQQHYSSFQRRIYSFENLAEMFALMQESEGSQITLSSDETHKLTLKITKTGFPMLGLETKEEVEP